MRILCNDLEYVSKNDYASQLLEYFVENFSLLYGVKSLSYNVHGLVHVANDALMFGPLDSYSAFQFENYLGKIKKLIKTSDKPLKQLINRIVEERNIPVVDSTLHCTFPSLMGQHDDGPLIPGCTGPQYHEVHFRNFTITTSERDNCVVLNNGSIVVVKNFAHNMNKLVVVGQKFNDVSNFFLQPCDSIDVGVYEAKNTSCLDCWPIESVIVKAMKLPREDGGFYICKILNLREVDPGS